MNHPTHPLKQNFVKNACLIMTLSLLGLIPSTAMSATPAPDSATISIEISDHRDSTRPTHALTYEINVKNTGDRKLEHVEVTSVAPAKTTITRVSNSGAISDQMISWSAFALGEGESQQFTVEVQVNKEASNGLALTATAKARDEDLGVSATDSDTTVVEHQGQVGVAAMTSASPIPTPTTNPVQPVPVTAQTGTTGVLASALILLGSAGLIAARTVATAN